jgi:hypothetical protein
MHHLPDTQRGHATWATRFEIEGSDKFLVQPSNPDTTLIETSTEGSLEFRTEIPSLNI